MIFRGGVKINVTCYIIKLDFDLDPLLKMVPARLKVVDLKIRLAATFCCHFVCVRKTVQQATVTQIATVTMIIRQQNARR